MSDSGNIINIITSRLNDKPGRKFFIYLSISLLLSLIGLFAAVATFYKGLTLWGINNNIVWGYDITNFIFWIGVGHAGTLISAILYLLNQEWRTSIHRIAESMTIFALIVAAFFPLIHTGRPWFSIYWLFPYFNQMGIMPNFKSPLVWDVFAILTYFIISLIFWYLGLIPDLFMIKNTLSGKIRIKLYNKLSFNWMGSEDQWRNYKISYLILAGLAAPLVISVHSIVSYDFSVAFIPAWHSTILPPYFVVGAIFSGCAFVNILTIMIRDIYKLEGIITELHIEKINKIILFTSMAIGFVYLTEYFMSYYQDTNLSQFQLINRKSFSLFFMILLNVIIPLFLFIKKIRRNFLLTFIISTDILIGMWLERFLLIIHGQEPSLMIANNSVYTPTIFDIMLLVGSFGVFFALFLLSTRLFPLIPLFETKISLIKNNKGSSLD